ncbi:hypothetical protein IW262DRAFT_1465907 [Armillaria fumosa]|nr:hypothetical protein IW262DRAFT_1465907 [Armillaria fumosa]
MDLKKGEQYVYMDYALLKSLMTDMPKSIIISYDIGCQWHKNLWKQIEQYGPELALHIKPNNVIILVPKFHLLLQFIHYFSYLILSHSTFSSRDPSTFTILMPYDAQPQ